MNQNFNLIHVGKCGGTTVREALSKFGISFNPIHTKAALFDSKESYVIILRNPVERFVSAFNWRYHLVNTSEKKAREYEGEKEILNRFKTVNNLAEKLYCEKGDVDFDLSKEYIHHIREDINFYIGDFLKSCNRESPVKVILTETMGEDIERLFGIKPDLLGHYKNNREKYDRKLSEAGRQNIKKHLEKDYECVERLFNLGLVSQKQYDILSV